MVITSKPKYSGVSIQVGPQALIVPSLSLRQFRDNAAVLTAAPDGEALADSITRTLPIITLALNRNYPEITQDMLCDELDLGGFREVFLAVQGASGLKVVEPGE